MYIVLLIFSSIVFPNCCLLYKWTAWLIEVTEFWEKNPNICKGCCGGERLPSRDWSTFLPCPVQRWAAYNCLCVSVEEWKASSSVHFRLLGREPPWFKNGISPSPLVQTRQSGPPIALYSILNKFLFQLLWQICPPPLHSCSVSDAILYRRACHGRMELDLLYSIPVVQ